MSSPIAFAEDLPHLAELEFHTALNLCAACTDYHALFGYDRLAHRKNGMSTDVEMLDRLFARYAAPGARILIGGAADSGLLALTARATLGRNPEITVADRCKTPLTICRAFAESHGLNVRTEQTDLSVAGVPNQYEVIFSHGVLLYIPRERHPAFFRNLAQSLSPNGIVLLVNWNASRMGREAAAPAEKRKDAVELLKDASIPLPEDEAVFRQRMAHRDEDYRKRFHIKLEAPEIEASIAAGGLRVRERLEHDKRVRLAVGDGAAPQARTYFFVLSHA